jgi:hypothetical protein
MLWHIAKYLPLNIPALEESGYSACPSSTPEKFVWQYLGVIFAYSTLPLNDVLDVVQYA